MRIEVSARHIAVPNMCPCCGNEADKTLVISVTQKHGKRASQKRTKTLQIPYCSLCLKHAKLWDIQGYIAGIVTLIALFIIGPVGIFFGLASLIITSLTAHSMLSNSCASERAVIKFVKWHGTVHVFDISSPTYAAAFMKANHAKLINLSSAARKLLQDTNGDGFVQESNQPIKSGLGRFSFARFFTSKRRITTTTPPNTMAPKVQEKEIIRLAEQYNGQITATQVATESSLSIAEAEALLKTFVERRYATDSITESGVTCYTFHFTNSHFSEQRDASPSSDSSTSSSQASSTAASETTEGQGKIRCVITGELLQNTPEEKVRQNVAKRLIKYYGYNKHDMEIEFPIKMGSSTKRADIAVFFKNEPHTQENIHLLVEAKAVHISTKDAQEAVKQLQSYIAASMNCQYAIFAWHVWRVFQIVTVNGRRKVKRIPDLPIEGVNMS